MVVLSSAVLLGLLTDYLNNPIETQQHLAFIYACGIAILACASLAISNLSLHMGWILSLQTKVILNGAIYQKVCYLNGSNTDYVLTENHHPQVLSLSQTTVGQLTVGHVVNLASNDVRLVEDVS